MLRCNMMPVARRSRARTRVENPDTHGAPRTGRQRARRHRPVRLRRSRDPRSPELETSMNTPASPDDVPRSWLGRLPLAFGAFFAVLGDAAMAAAYAALRRGPVAAPAPAAPAPAVLKVSNPEAALQLLALLQRDARLIDFVGESLGAYDDAQIGAAARVVHEGCAKVLREHFSLVPVRDEAEGSRVTLPAGFDAAAVRLTGKVVGAAPHTGTLSHRGWRVTEVRLPQLSERHDVRVLAPAEVEL